MKELKREINSCPQRLISEFDRKNMYYLELPREVGGSKYTPQPGSCLGSVTRVSPREILPNRDRVKDIMIETQVFILY